MYCSGCGRALEAGQIICPQCNRPVVPSVPVPPPVPPVPAFEFEVARYAGKVRALGILWIVYASVSLLLGFAGLSFARAIFEGGIGPWAHGPLMPPGMMPIWMHLAWLALSIRAVLCVVAGWGLLERTQWGRIVAIVAAILSLIKIPFGTALGVASLVILLGYRNSTLYDHL